MRKSIFNSKSNRSIVLIAAVLLISPLTTMAQWSSGTGGGIYYNGKVSIGTIDFVPAYALNVTGTTNLTGTLFTDNLTFASELRIGKTSVTPSLIRGFNNTLVINVGDETTSTTLSATGANFIVKGKTYFAANGTDPFKNVSSNNNFNVFVEQGLITPEVGIAAPSNWADYVFKEDYQLAPLDSVEAYINENGHLPGIPSADEVHDTGFYSANNLAIKLLEKVEELTLYTIEQDKEIRRLLAELEKYKNEKK